MMSYAAKGDPYGENGYLSNSYNLMMDSLQSEYDEKNSFATSMMVSAVLTMRNPETLETREITITSKTTGTKSTMKLLCFAQNQRYLDDVSPERWCKTQVTVLKNYIPTINYLTYGGDATLNGMPPVLSLDQILVPDDVQIWLFHCTKRRSSTGHFLLTVT